MYLTFKQKKIEMQREKEDKMVVCRTFTKKDRKIDDMHKDLTIELELDILES